LTAGTIDFEGVTEGVAVPSLSDSGVTVFFGVDAGLVAPSLSAFGAEVGGPPLAFVPNDTPNALDPLASEIGSGMLTDEDVGHSVGNNYFMSFSVPVPDLWLHLLDFRGGEGDGGADVGDTATLTVFSTADWGFSGGSSAFDVFTIPIAALNPVDGNVVLLEVLNPGFAIQSARLSFSTPDDGNAIDNVSWTTIPEPGTVALFGSGLLALAAFGRRRRTRS
jgi:hypothetical protein